MAAPDPDVLRRNAVLAALSQDEFERMRQSAEVIDSKMRDKVYEMDGMMESVYFPLGAVFSLVAVTEERINVEVATVGREAMVGMPVFLGAFSSPQMAFCQVPGQAARVSAGELRKLLTDGGSIHRLLNRCVQALMAQIAQNVVCNATHSVEQRAARWLLTTHDRVEANEFELTQEFLAQMLGVRRPTVSETASRFQEHGFIRYARGHLNIINRAGLEAITCACYKVVRAEFDALIGPDPGR